MSGRRASDSKALSGRVTANFSRFFQTFVCAYTALINPPNPQTQTYKLGATSVPARDLGSIGPSLLMQPLQGNGLKRLASRFLA